jgi:hypothetical protein
MVSAPEAGTSSTAFQRLIPFQLAPLRHGGASPIREEEGRRGESWRAGDVGSAGGCRPQRWLPLVFRVGSWHPSPTHSKRTRMSTRAPSTGLTTTRPHSLHHTEGDTRRGSAAAGQPIRDVVHRWALAGRLRRGGREWRVFLATPRVPLNSRDEGPKRGV